MACKTLSYKIAALREHTNLAMAVRRLRYQRQPEPAQSSGRQLLRLIARLAMLMLMVVGAKLAGAAEPSLEFGLGDVTHRFTASELLARPDAAEVDIPNDHDYRRATHYRAVPLLPLLAGLPPDRLDTLEARATDGFVAQIPLSLVRKGAEGGATAWIAVEPPRPALAEPPGQEYRGGTVLPRLGAPRALRRDSRAVALSISKPDNGREPGPPLATTGR